MNLKSIAVGLFWLAVILMALPAISRIGRRAVNETKDDPLVKGTSGVVGDWVSTALGNTGSGGGFGGFGSGSRSLAAEERRKRALAELDASDVAVSDAVLESRLEYDRAQAVEKRTGKRQEWHPRIKWTDVNPTTPGAPIAVSIDVYRCDPALVDRISNPAGVSSTVATFLAKRGDPPTSLAGNVNLMDGVQYAFQAFVPNSDDEASILIGPYTFIKGNGWQKLSGREAFKEDLELMVTK